MSHQMFHKVSPKPIVVAGRVLKVLFWFFVITTPMLGVWLASSLAAYFNGPRWLAFVAGALLFPVLPTAWEIWVARRRAKKGIVETRYLTGFDRIILRTLFLNAVFISTLLFTNPSSAFTALSARGDWVLDGNQSDTADHVREKMYWTADRLEWLYNLTQDNPYQEIQQSDDSFDPTPPDNEGALPVRLIDTDAGEPPPQKSEVDSDKADISKSSPSDSDSAAAKQTVDSDTALQSIDSDTTTKTADSDPMQEDADSDAATKTADSDATQEDVDSDTATKSATETVTDETDDSKEQPEKESSAKISWPFENRVHPAVMNMPESEKKTIPKIAAYLRSKENNPYLLAKAVHDYVVERVHYDYTSLEAGRYPPYDAHTVNRTKNGVCAGYAALFAAIAKAAGFTCANITGKVRKRDGNIDGTYHAWNAIQIKGNWYLVDPTWDSPHADGNEKDDDYKTDYFLTPPAVFARDHFPMNAKWQLMAQPISRGEFIRQPMMTASFYRQQLRLISPNRSQVTVDKDLVIEIETPAQRYLMATYNEKGQEASNDCIVYESNDKATITCHLPGNNTYQIVLYSGANRYGTYSSVGYIEAVRL